MSTKGPDAATSSDASVEGAALNEDANPDLFDVDILYADRVLPDVAAAPPDASGDARGARDATEDAPSGPVPCTHPGQKDCILMPCTASFLASLAEAGAPDAGTPDAGAPEGGSRDAASDAEAGAPYCVSCGENLNGVCSETEAYFVAIDIAQGAATAPGPDPEGSCYFGLTKNPAHRSTPCLDRNHVTGKECDDLGTADFTSFGGVTAPGSATCLSTLMCILGQVGHGCSLYTDTVKTGTCTPGEDGCPDSGLVETTEQEPTTCLCGQANEPVLTCSALMSTASFAGPCAAEELNGFGLPNVAPPGSPSAIITNYVDVAEPSGLANNIVNCALNQGLYSASQGDGGILGKFTCFPP
jgi:hypothetical protein